MKIKILLATLILCSAVNASGGFDNGTSTGKGKFQLDLTWNPWNKFDFGQSYAVISYGLTSKFDIHSYISYHADSNITFYGGLFYQFLDRKKLHLATAIGVRKNMDYDWNHLFLPQLLFTSFINEKYSIGGSFVNVNNLTTNYNYGIAMDLSFFYKTKIKTKAIESVSIGLGIFHPTTWEPKNYFLPTYSIDIKFN